MKAVYPVFLVFLLVVGVSAQSLVNPSDAHNLVILQKQWRVEVHDPALEEDPFRANNEFRQAERETKETLKRNEIRARQGLSPEPNTARLRQLEDEVALQRDDDKPSTIYFYEIKVKNASEKEIQTIAWDYVFFEPGTEREVGRRQFASKVNIAPGKTKSLMIRSVSPPTGTINVKNAGKKTREQYAEQVIIIGIDYLDGSAWKAGETLSKKVP